MTDKTNKKQLDYKLLTKVSDLWQTPPELFNKLNTEFKFDYDVCANDKNNLAPCKGDYFIENYENCICFMNPPFSNSLPFIKRALLLRQSNVTTVCLLKCDTSTRLFGLLWDYNLHRSKPGIEIRFFPKRIQYNHPIEKSMSSCSFPSMLVIIKPN